MHLECCEGPGGRRTEVDWMVPVSTHWPACTKIQGICWMDTKLSGLDTAYQKSAPVAKYCWSSYAVAQGVSGLEGMSWAAQGVRHCKGAGQWRELCQGLGTSVGHLGGVQHHPLHVLCCSQPETLAPLPQRFTLCLPSPLVFSFRA